MMDSGADSRRVVSGVAVVTAARSWIGTPYRHQASCHGAGCDCLGLLRGIWRELIGPEPEAVPAYSPDWAESAKEETLLAAAGRMLLPVATAEVAEGDVLVLRMREAGIAKHVGFRASGADGHPSLIHAYSGHGVVESPMTPAWARRVAAAFRFPSRSL